MIEDELQAEAEKLVDYIQSLGTSFSVLKAEPSDHIGAIILDAVLQVGHRWQTHVERRVKRIETAYPGASNLAGLRRLLVAQGAQELLDWRGRDEQERFVQTVEFFSNEKVGGMYIDTVDQLAQWLALDGNRDRLLTKSERKDRAGIPRVADKTADYYCVMVGLPDAVAVDRLITGFLRDACVRGRSRYHKAKMIVQSASRILSVVRKAEVRPVDLDVSIWTFQSRRRDSVSLQSQQCQPQSKSNRTLPVTQSKSSKEVNMKCIMSASPVPSQERAIVEAKNNDTWQNSEREILIHRNWTACLVCWGGPLDLSTLQSRPGVSLHHKKGKKPYLWIPVKLWVAGRMYNGKLRYDLTDGGACISNPLNGGAVKLGNVMTNAGFAAKEQICLRFVMDDVWVLKAPRNDLCTIY